MNRLKTLYGEPVAVVGAIQAVLTILASFHALTFIGIRTQSDLMLLIAVETAVGTVYLAVTTHHTLLAPVVELFKAGAAFAAIYGYHMTTKDTGTVIAAITMVLAMFHRTQTSPTVAPSRGK